MNARRKAFTLVELLTVMTVFSAIFGTVMLTLYAMQKTSRGFTDGIATSAQQQRFDTQLRVDAHQSRDAELKANPGDAAPTLLELTLSDNQVVKYQLYEDRIERQAFSLGNVVHQELYSVSPVLNQGWSLDDKRPFPLLSVQLNQNAGHGSDTSPTLIPIRVDAAVRIAASSETASPETASSARNSRISIDDSVRTLPMIHQETRCKQRYRGIALPLVLFCIVLAMGIGASLLQAVLLHHRQAKSVAQQHQSLWLAESGVQRAIYKLRSSPKYRGEVWTIPAATLGDLDDGRVTIQVEPQENDPASWKVVVEAVYPDHPQHRTVQQRVVEVARLQTE